MSKCQIFTKTPNIHEIFINGSCSDLEENEGQLYLLRSTGPVTTPGPCKPHLNAMLT